MRSIGSREAVLVGLALATVTACRRPRAHRSARNADDEPAVACPALQIGEETRLSDVETGAEGASIARVADVAIAAWIEHPASGSAVVMARWLTADGRAGPPAFGVGDLAPPPASAVLPSVARVDDGVWIVFADDLRGCRASRVGIGGGRTMQGPVTVGPGVCFAPAIDTSRSVTVVLQTATGWRAAPLERAGQDPMRYPIVAPAGDRWMARADDGTMATSRAAGTVDEIEVRRADGRGSRVIATGPSLAQLAIERVRWGYAVAWTPRGASQTTVLRLDDALQDIDGAENIDAGGGGLAIARWQDEAWVATSSRSGDLRVVRFARHDRRPGIDAPRTGTVSDVGVAALRSGGVLAWSAEGLHGTALNAMQLRCAR